MAKCIYFGKVERPAVLGRKKWEPLYLPWNLSKKHGFIKAEFGSDWIGVLNNMIDSILRQKGRVLIIDRREPNTDHVPINFAEMIFNGVSTHVLRDLEDTHYFKTFVNARAEFDAGRRLTYIPQSSAFKDSDKNSSLIAQRIREAIAEVFTTPIDTTKEDITDNQTFWENAPPILIITLGKPWYEDQIVVAAQLRAISVASYHVFYSYSEMDAQIEANSLSKIFLFAKKSNHDEVDITDGLLNTFESSPKIKWFSKSVNLLFQV